MKFIVKLNLYPIITPTMTAILNEAI